MIVNKSRISCKTTKKTTKMEFRCAARQDFLKFLLVALVVYSCASSTVSHSSLKKWCYHAPGLNSAQKRMCKDAKGLRSAIRIGLNKGIKMCESEFRNNPWNCSVLGKQSLLVRAPEGTKEAAFTTAITAAALAFQISHSCGKGNSVPCSCEVSKRSAGRVDSSKLNKCRINIPHGTTFASSFLSVTSDSSSPVSDIDRHNIQVGLKMVTQTTITQCKPTKNPKHRECWLTLAPFKSIVATLKGKYFKAQKVTSLRLKENRAKKMDLFYLNQSPNYCKRDEQAGVPGTRGRLCKASSLGEEGCAKICCGRGHQTHTYIKTQPCQCKFTRCTQKCKSPGSFEMVCEQCSDRVSQSRCN